MKIQLIRNYTLLFMAITLIFSSFAWADKKTGFSEISAPMVKNLRDLNQATIIHVLSELEFKMQHIPGSINIQVNKLKQSDLFPKNLDQPIIFYCMGKR
jgi:hypothetical protein